MSIYCLFSDSLTTRFISRGCDKFCLSLGTNRPADFAMKLLAALNKIFGSFSRNVVPKS